MFCHPEELFYYKLAEDLSMTVRQIKEGMDSAEISGWIAYYRIKRFKEEEAKREAKSQSRHKK